LETERKEYEKPQVIYREQMEAMANVCTPPIGKAAGACQQGNS